MHKKIILFLFTLISISAMAQQKIVQTAGRTQLGEFAPELAFPKGSANTAYARYFVGNSYLAPLTPKNLGEGEQSVLPMNNVTFEPGCRNNWHIYPSRCASNTHLRCRERVVSRMGETCYCTTDGRYYRHSGRRETLARGTERCVVSTYCHTYKRRRHHLQRMVGSSVGRNIQSFMTFQTRFRYFVFYEKSNCYIYQPSGWLQ